MTDEEYNSQLQNLHLKSLKAKNFSTIMDSLKNPIVAGISSVGNLFSTIMTNKKRQELAELQNKWNLEQWNRQNAYDSPQAQMQRLTDAGLNPNLIYGSMSSGSPSAPATSASGSIETPMLDMSPFLYASQIELAKSQAHKNYVDSNNSERLTDLEIRREFGDTPVSQATIENLKATAAASYAQVQKISQDISESVQRINNMKADEARQLLENIFNRETFLDRVNIISNEQKISKAESDVRSRVLQATIAELFSRQKLNSQNAEFLRIKTNDLPALDGYELRLKDALVNYYVAASSNQNSNSALINSERVLTERYGDADHISTYVNVLSNLIGNIIPF